MKKNYYFSVIILLFVTLFSACKSSDITPDPARIVSPTSIVVTSTWTGSADIDLAVYSLNSNGTANVRLARSISVETGREVFTIDPTVFTADGKYLVGGYEGVGSTANVQVVTAITSPNGTFTTPSRTVTSANSTTPTALLYITKSGSTYTLSNQ